MSQFGPLYRSFVAFSIVVATLTVMAVLCIILVVADVVVAIMAVALAVVLTRPKRTFQKLLLLERSYVARTS